MSGGGGGEGSASFGFLIDAEDLEAAPRGGDGRHGTSAPPGDSADLQHREIVSPQPTTFSTRRDDGFRHETLPTSAAAGGGGDAEEGFALGDGKSDSGGRARWLQLSSYAHHFELDEQAFKRRLMRSFLIPKGEDFLAEGEVPEVYGPIWIGITLVLALATGSSLHLYFSGGAARQSAADVPLHFGFSHFVAIFVGVAVYVSGASVVTWAVRRYYGMRTDVVEALCVIGYSLAPLVVAALVAMVPSTFVSLLAALGGAVVSTLFLQRTLWRQSDYEELSDVRSAVRWRRPAAMMALLSCALHAALVMFTWWILYARSL